jgi:antitoxin PrlF
MCEAKLGEKGRITIPADVRHRLGLHPGDRVLFSELGDDVRISRARGRSIMDLQGIAKWDGPPVTIEEMNETIAEGWAGLLEFDD